jgi:hypothetical protein
MSARCFLPQRPFEWEGWLHRRHFALCGIFLGCLVLLPFPWDVRVEGVEDSGARREANVLWTEVADRMLSNGGCRAVTSKVIASGGFA